MKTTMDKDTILFVDANGKGLGMYYYYYTKHYNEIKDQYGHPVNVYYKAGASVDTWIDYQRAIQVKKGSINSRVQQALDDNQFHIDVRLIPQTDFYDKEGDIHKIAPYDGFYNATQWVQRVDSPELKQGYDYSIDITGSHVIVTFNEDVDLANSFISLNKLFYPYTIIDSARTIKFPNVVEELGINTINFTQYTDDELEDKMSHLKAEIAIKTSLINNKERELKNPNLTEAEINAINSVIMTLVSARKDLSEEYEMLYNKVRRVYNVKVNVYTWENLVKSAPLYPVNRVGEWFETESPIDDNAIIIYKGQIIDHEVSIADNCKFKLHGFSLMSLDAFELGKMRIYKVSTSESGKFIKKYSISGHKNKHKDTVEFVLPVSQSLIVYEGIDHEYEVHDEATIMYGFSNGSTLEVSDTSDVHSINFSRVG